MLEPMPARVDLAQVSKMVGLPFGFCPRGVLLHLKSLKEKKMVGKNLMEKMLKVRREVVKAEVGRPQW